MFLGLDPTQWMLFLSVMAVAAVLAGFLAGLFGIGGGAVMVPVFSELFVVAGVEPGLAQFVAVGTSLAVIVPTGLRSAKSHYDAQNMDLDTLKKYLMFIPLGVVLGLLFANRVEGGTLTLVFGLVALGLAIYMLAQAKELRFAEGGPKTPVAQIGATIMGIFSLLMGIGGGVMNNIFMMVQGTPIKRAIGTSSGVGVLIAIPGAIGFIIIGWGAEGLPPLSLGYVNLIAMGLVIPITVYMAPIGARVTHKLPAAFTSRLFGCFLLIVAARMIWKSFL